MNFDRPALYATWENVDAAAFSRRWPNFTPREIACKGIAPWAITASGFVLGAVVQEFFQTLESLSGRVARDPLRAVADIVGAVRGLPVQTLEDDHASQRIRPQSPDAF